VIHEFIEDIGAQNDCPWYCDQHIGKLIKEFMGLNYPVDECEAAGFTPYGGISDPREYLVLIIAGFIKFCYDPPTLSKSES
jgi:hypothetical protein